MFQGWYTIYVNTCMNILQYNGWQKCDCWNELSYVIGVFLFRTLAQLFENIKDRHPPPDNSGPTLPTQ